MISILKELSMIGNPSFVDSSINYEQDKVVVLKKILKKSSSEEIKIILEKYIDFIKKSWEYGFSEISFNFHVNYGILNEKLVLIDFNEITFSIDDVKMDIRNETWIKRWSYSSLNENMKEYYKKRMREELTVENLENIWNTKNI